MADMGQAAGGPSIEELELIAIGKSTFAQLRLGISRNSTNRLALGGNLCVLSLTFSDGTSAGYYAHSNYSSLTVALKRIYVPSVPAEEFGRIGIARGCQLGNHTEPKVFYAAYQNGDFAKQIVRMQLYSELPCCGSCVKNTLKALAGAEALLALTGSGCPFIVVETSTNQVRNGWNFM